LDGGVVVSCEEEDVLGWIALGCTTSEYFECPDEAIGYSIQDPYEQHYEATAD
jgi:hypothetical protein